MFLKFCNLFGVLVKGIPPPYLKIHLISTRTLFQYFQILNKITISVFLSRSNPLTQIIIVTFELP